MKRLLVTADDVGLHRGMTDGAIRAHQEGIVRACSVVANGAAFDHAVERLREVPTLHVGIHLTLVEERPILEDVPSLVGTNGLFHESYVGFVPRYLGGRIAMDEVERELRAQIEKVLATGLKVRHLNSHQHLHLLPKIFDVVETLAMEHGIGHVRTVDEVPSAGSAVRRWSINALSRLGREARGRARVTTNDRSIGVISAGHLTADAVIALLERVDGLTELVTHPGLDASALTQAYDWEYGWEDETAALCDPRVSEAIAAKGIELVGLE